LVGIGLVTIGVLWVMLRLFVVVIPVVVALLLTALLAPLARRLVGRGLPPLAAVWVVMLSLFGLLALAVWWIVPSVTSEATTLSSSISGGFTRIENWLVTGPLGLSSTRVDGWSTSLRSQVGSFESQFAKGALSRTPLALELVAGSVVALVLTFFFLKDGAELVARNAVLRAPHRRARLDGVWDAFSGYAQGLVVNAAVNALVIGVALVILRVPLAMPIAALTFAASFVPVIGAIVSGAIAALVALVAVGPAPALVLVGVTIGIHHLEGYVVGPLVIGRHTGLHPIVLILALIVGVKLGGVPGGFLAGPIAAASVGWLAGGNRGIAGASNPAASTAADVALPNPPAGEPDPHTTS
jgi:predicted PurR-regulated permease PerM